VTWEQQHRESPQSHLCAKLPGNGDKLSMATGSCVGRADGWDVGDMPSVAEEMGALQTAPGVGIRDQLWDETPWAGPTSSQDQEKLDLSGEYSPWDAFLRDRCARANQGRLPCCLVAGNEQRNLCGATEHLQLYLKGSHQYGRCKGA